MSWESQEWPPSRLTWREPDDPSVADEDRYEAQAALCDVCGNRPGEVAQDGDWICSRCVVLLELADQDPPSSAVRQ